ncbi:MAG: S-layer homology domain-containing protein, partial [Planctomycetes bacterium]|nr:S-layer homology domain-containing protein [Planctomycetota bacterium]
RVIDVSDPAAPVAVGYWGTCGGALGVAVAGDYAYVVGAGGLQVISIADPANPVEVGFCDAPYYDPSRPTGVAVAGDYAYVVGTGITSWPYTPVGRLWVISVSDPANPVEVGFYERTDSYFNGVAVAGDYAYVAALGLCVISVADPANPVEVRYWGMPGRAEGVAVAGDYAYLADPFAGLRVISVADPANPVQVGHCDIPDDGEARGVAVVAGYAYVAADEVGLRMIDVSNPRAPVEVRYWDTPGSARTVTAGGGYAYLGDRSWGMLVFRAPSFDDVRLAHWAFWETEACVAAGIVAGYDDGLFHPTWSVGRSQMAVFISRSICTPTGEAGMADYVPPDTPTFADVPTDHWAYKYVEYCVASEVVGGYPYPDPDNPGQDIYLYLPILGVTRDQMAVFISRAVAGGDDNVPDGPAAATFNDVPVDHWAYKYVEYCAAEDIVHGYDPVTY